MVADDVDKEHFYRLVETLTPMVYERAFDENAKVEDEANRYVLNPEITKAANELIMQIAQELHKASAERYALL